MNQAPQPQHSTDAEQALLGAILVDGKLIERVQGFLQPQHFSYPLHGNIYAVACELHSLQRTVSAVTVNTYMKNDEELIQHGGSRYIMDLAGSAASLLSVTDYAKLILDLAVTRDLIGFAEDVANEAFVNPDPGPQITRHIQALERMAAQCDMDGIRTVADMRGEIMDFYDGKRKKSYSTGYKCLDPHYMVVPGEMTIVTGLPGSGKSNVIDHILVKLATYENWRFALCSLENPNEVHATKLASIYLSMKFRGPTRMSREQLDRALDWVQDHFVFVKVTNHSPTIDWALSRIEAAHRERPINGFVLDPYNEFEHRLERGQREDLYISEMLAKVKRLGARMQAHQWFVAHPKTAQANQDDEAPSLSQISGGGNWANKADYGLSIHRKWDEGTGRRSTTTEVHVKKVRFSWETTAGIARLEYDESTVSYRDPEAEDRMAWPD